MGFYSGSGTMLLRDPGCFLVLSETLFPHVQNPILTVTQLTQYCPESWGSCYSNIKHSVQNWYLRLSCSMSNCLNMTPAKTSSPFLRWSKKLCEAGKCLQKKSKCKDQFKSGTRNIWVCIVYLKSSFHIHNSLQTQHKRRQTIWLWGNASVGNNSINADLLEWNMGLRGIFQNHL